MSPRRTWYPHKQQLAAWSLTAEPRTLRASSHSPHTALEPTLLALDPAHPSTQDAHHLATSDAVTRSPAKKPRPTPASITYDVPGMYVCRVLLRLLLVLRVLLYCCCYCCCFLLLFVIVHLSPGVVLYTNSSSSTYCKSFLLQTKILQYSP